MNIYLTSFNFCSNDFELGLKVVIIIFSRPHAKQSMQIDGATVVK